MDHNFKIEKLLEDDFKSLLKEENKKRTSLKFITDFYILSFITQLGTQSNFYYFFIF